MSGRVVEVRIDELALGGVGPADRDRVADAATRELRRLLAGRAAWASQAGPDALTLDGGELEPDGPGPESLGTAVARAVHGRLVR